MTVFSGAKMSSGEGTELTSESSTSEENSQQEILPSKLFECKFPNSDSSDQPEYYFETDHVSTLTGKVMSKEEHNFQAETMCNRFFDCCSRMLKNS